MNEAVKIITQQGEPVDEAPKPEEPENFSPIEEIRAAVEDINEGLKGFRKFRNSIIVKVGVVAVAIKIIDITGKIIMENQRLKAKPPKDDKE